MAQPKGSSGNPNGRPKGSVNKTTADLRATINAIVEGAIPDIVSSLGEIRETQPAKYTELVLKLLEYSLPKLRQTDTTLDISEDTVKRIQVLYGQPKPEK